VPILSHAAIHVGIPFEGASGLTICEPELACAWQVSVNAFDGLVYLTLLEAKCVEDGREFLVPMPA
jgi:hypothetical protein